MSCEANLETRPLAERLQAAVARTRAFVAQDGFGAQTATWPWGALLAEDLWTLPRAACSASSPTKNLTLRKFLAERVAKALACAEPSAAESEMARTARSASCIAAIRSALEFADALGLLRAPEILPLIALLTQAQRSDGAWADAQGNANLSLTGIFAGYLTRTFQVRASVLARAGQYLSQRWSPALLRGDASECWDVLIAFAQFYAVNDGEHCDEILQRCGRELERAYRKQTVQALDLAYLFQLCEAEAFPAVSATSAEVVAAILASQREDGSWAGSCATHGDAVAATFFAITALKRLTR